MDRSVMDGYCNGEGLVRHGLFRRRFRQNLKRGLVHFFCDGMKSTRTTNSRLVGFSCPLYLRIVQKWNTINECSVKSQSERSDSQHGDADEEGWPDGPKYDTTPSPALAKKRKFADIAEMEYDQRVQYQKRPLRAHSLRALSAADKKKPFIKGIFRSERTAHWYRMTILCS